MTTTSAASSTTSSSSVPASTTTTDTPTSIESTGPATVPPAWLGTRALPLRPDGYGEIRPTPSELVDRRFPPPWRLGLGGDEFEATIGAVPADVVARSTWHEGCPVRLEDLSYLTMTFRGFDGGSHVGEMIVDASVAEDVVAVFRQLFEAGYPIEEMRVVATPELDAPPTGDGNNTTAFVCRPVTDGSDWSQHAYGLAIDVNPFHNPYVKGDLVLPELATFYLDRELQLSGMIVEGSATVRAFDSIGWGWGGRWRSLDDNHHFSANGR